MNKKAYYRVLSELEKELNNGSFQPFLNVVKIFDNVYEVASHLNFIAFSAVNTRNASLNQAADNERNKVSTAISNAIKKDKASTLFMSFAANYFELKKYITDVINHEGVSQKTSYMLTCYLELMERFSNGFENYRKDYSASSAYSLSFIAKQLLVETDNLNLVIGTILSHYQAEEISDGGMQLEIYLSNIPTLKQFGIKLQALDELHAEICMLFNVSLSENPLLIEHIENGSLLARISGNPLAVGVLTTILSISANYYITQYSTQNKIVELKESVTTLDDMFDLSEKLKAEGYNVDDMQDSINKSLIKIAKSTNTLLGDQPSIEVNDKQFKLDDADKVKMLEASQKLLDHNSTHSSI